MLMREIIKKNPKVNLKSKDRCNLTKIVKIAKANMKAMAKFNHFGIAKSQIILYSERGTADGVFGVMDVVSIIVFIITLLLYRLNLAGIIHLPPSWVR